MKITDYGKQYLNEQDKFDISIDNDFSVDNKPKHTNVKTGVIDTNLMGIINHTKKRYCKKEFFTSICNSSRIFFRRYDIQVSNITRGI